jgi:transcriptional regulator with XRE-family HTH domain
MKDSSSIPEAIRRERRARDVTQRELGVFLGCSQGSVAKIERGTLAPKLEQIRRIEKLFGVRLGDD